VALELAGRICAAAPLAVWASRKVVVASLDENEKALRKMTDDAFGQVMNSEDLKEGLEAFIEKRPPNWRGR
jgi:enoyl-CoA hydratase